MRDAASLTGSADARYATADRSDAGRLAYAAEGKNADPYAGFEARIVPENITLLPKTSAQPGGGSAGTNEKVVTVKKGDTIATILRDLGAAAATSRRSPRCSVRAAATAG